MQLNVGSHLKKVPCGPRQTQPRANPTCDLQTGLSHTGVQGHGTPLSGRLTLSSATSPLTHSPGPRLPKRTGFYKWADWTRRKVPYNFHRPLDRVPSCHFACPIHQLPPGLPTREGRAHSSPVLRAEVRASSGEDKRASVPPQFWEG